MWFPKRASQCLSITSRRRRIYEFSGREFPSDYIKFDMEVAMPQPLVDAESIAWRQGSRKEEIKLIMGSQTSQENEDPMKIVTDDDSEEIIVPMATKSVSEALQIVDCVMRFSQQHGNEELDQSLITVTEKL